MSRPFVDYLALALIGDFKKPEEFYLRTDKPDFSGNYLELQRFVEEKIGVPVPQELLRQAVRSIADCGLVRVTEDQFADTHIKVYRSKFSEFVEKAQSERESALTNGDLSAEGTRNARDYPNWLAYDTHELFVDYHEFGGSWLERAFNGIKKQYESTGNLPGEDSSAQVLRQFDDVVPASDRIVSLSHNQYLEVEKPLGEVIDAVTRDNGDPESPGFRERVLGQLKAGRELMISGSFRLYLLKETLVSALGELVRKHRGQALGIAAAKLLELLIEKIFEAST